MEGTAMLTKDKQGILCQLNGAPGIKYEGGDSLNWQGHFNYLMHDWVKHPNMIRDIYISQFESKNHPGLWVRHPNKKQSEFGFASYCEGNWRGVESRDQLAGKLCYLAKAGAKKALWRSLWMHLKRGMIFANNSLINGKDPKLDSSHKLPDPTLFDIWSIYIRGLRLWFLWPILLVMDLHLLANAIINRFSDDSDNISHAIKCILANDIYPTPIVWLINRINKKEQELKKMKKYWCGWRKQCGMYNLYVPFIEKYWKG